MWFKRRREIWVSEFISNLTLLVRKGWRRIQNTHSCIEYVKWNIIIIRLHESSPKWQHFFCMEKYHESKRWSIYEPDTYTYHQCLELETIRWKSELFVAKDDQDYLDSLVANLMTEILLQKCPSQIKGLIMKSSLNLLKKNYK